MTVRLTGRGAIVLLFVPCFLGLLLGWDVVADACFIAGCGVGTYYLRPHGLVPMISCPPLVFATACVFAEVFTRSGLLSIAEGILLTMANAAPWLFSGTALAVVVAIGRGVGPQVRSLLGVR